MPIVDEDQLSALLADERIMAITVDTNIFDEKGLQLNSPTLQVLASLRGKPIKFILSGTVAQEILAHIEKAMASALRAAKKEIGQALHAFETEAPTRDELLDLISNGRTVSEASRQRFDKYINDTGCEVLNDPNLADLAVIFDDYFAKRPPFGSKSEFPDALALNALERLAKDRQVGILVVSKDGDWRSFCVKSDHLYHVPNIERALALINRAPLGLRQAIQCWFAEGAEGREVIMQHLEQNIEQVEFTVNAIATSGQMEADVWSATLNAVDGLDVANIDIIETKPLNEGNSVRVIVSLPLFLVVRVLVELSFSLWDSIDKECVGMGGRQIEVDEELNVRVTITFVVSGLGTEKQEIALEASELDTQYHEIELGEVDVFEPEDYWHGEESV